jgi:hypothetical protein
LRFSPNTIIGRSSMNLAGRLVGALVADTSNNGASAFTVTDSEAEPI